MKLDAISLKSPNAIILIVGSGLALGAAVWSWSQFVAASREARALRIRQNEWSGLTEIVPRPTANEAAKISADVERAERSVREMRRRLGGGRDNEVEHSTVPDQRADAFFEIARYVERERERARAVGVGLKPNEFFGFRVHENSGPEDAFIGVVHRQQKLTELVLAALWNAHPLRLTLVEREPPESKVAPSEKNGGMTAPTRAVDFFTLPEDLSVGRGDYLDTLALRIGFTGQTDVLRRFLNQLPEISAPVLVRAIEVRSAGDGGGGSGDFRSLDELFRDDAAPDVAPEDAPAVPIIERNVSEFVVTLEYLDFAAAARRANSEAESEDNI